MTNTAQEVLTAAMALDDADRAELADRLFESVDTFVEESHLAAWELEIKSRLNDIDAGRVKMNAAEDVIRRLRAEADQSGQNC